MAKGDRTKWDYFLDMQWAEFQNYYILFNEERKELIDDLNTASRKGFESYVVRALSQMI
jgi:hypothetical protein